MSWINRIKSIKSIKYPLYIKVMFSFMMILITFSLVLIIGNNIASRSMKNYFEEKMIERYELVLDDIVELLESQDWDPTDPLLHRRLSYQQKKNGIYLAVIDTEDQIIYETPSRNEFGRPDHEVAFDEIRGTEPNVIEQKVEIYNENQVVGYVRIVFIDTFSMKPVDIQLFKTMQQVFTLSIVTCLIVTVILSILIARSITIPISQVGKTANAISEGDLKARANTDTNIKELVDLSKNINAMAIKLEQEDLLRTQATSDMAHEIRTPLTVLRNFFEAFLDGVYEVNDENLNQCYSEVVRMSDLVDRLKDLTNIEAMTIKAKIECIDLCEETKNLCDLSKPAFDKKGIELQFSGNQVCEAYMDPGHFRQVMTNLISNALRYTDEKGKVEILINKFHDRIEIAVSDNGIGMSLEDQKYIFERFYRADKSRDRESGGLGVGLTIVKKMVEFYGGDIQIQSELGVGTMVTVIYPLSEISS